MICSRVQRCSAMPLNQGCSRIGTSFAYVHSSATSSSGGTTWRGRAAAAVMICAIVVTPWATTLLSSNAPVTMRLPGRPSVATRQEDVVRGAVDIAAPVHIVGVADRVEHRRRVELG